MIDWEKFWEEFDEWYLATAEKCDCCGRKGPHAEWEEQQAKIQELVEKEVEEIVIKEGSKAAWNAKHGVYPSIRDL